MQFFASFVRGRMAIAMFLVVINMFASVFLMGFKAIGLVEFDIIPVEGRKRGRIANVRWSWA